jgi:1,4-dihydroxy-2-naphthoate octaprenyltransferase
MLQTNNLKYQWTAQNPGMLLLCLIIGFTGSVALISLAVINFYQLILGIVAIILCFCYNQKIFGIHLRSKRGLKAFTIALVIIISGVLIPSAKYYWQEIQVQLFLIYVVAQFCFVAAFCIAADIRDIKEDKEDHIDTFPVIAGIEISKTISILLLVIQLSLLVILYSLSFFNLAQFEGFIFISLLSLHFIKQLHTKNSYYYFIIGIDGLIAAQAMSLIIFSI